MGANAGAGGAADTLSRNSPTASPQFDDFIKSELKRWPEVAKAAGRRNRAWATVKV
jgi:hypothetical protein